MRKVNLIFVMVCFSAILSAQTTNNYKYPVVIGSTVAPGVNGKLTLKGSTSGTTVFEAGATGTTTVTGTIALPSTTSIGTVSSTEIGYIDGATSSLQTQITALTTGTDTSLHYVATIGIYRNVGVGQREYFVYDIDGNGELEELAAAIVVARTYHRTIINVAGGAYNLTAPLIFNYDNYMTEVRGNNTYLWVPHEYSGNAIEITSTGDLSGLKISGLRFREIVGAGEHRLWNGIYVTMTTGQDLQMSYFSDLVFDHCGTAISVYLLGAGWMNANNFTDIRVSSFIRFLKVRGASTWTSEFGGNIFNNIRLQCTNGVTTVGVDSLPSIVAGATGTAIGNVFRDFRYWDAPAGTYAIITGIRSYSTFCEGSIPYQDLAIVGHTNYFNGLYVTSGNNVLRQNYADITDRLEIRGNTVLVPKATGDIDPAIGITAAMFAARIDFTDVANTDITADPQIANGLYNGQIIMIYGAKNGVTLTLDDGTGLRLAGNAQWVGDMGDNIVLMYDSTITNDWVEISRANN